MTFAPNSFEGSQTIADRILRARKLRMDSGSTETRNRSGKQPQNKFRWWPASGGNSLPRPGPLLWCMIWREATMRIVLLGRIALLKIWVVTDTRMERSEVQGVLS